jgi:hypothetical protein
MSIQIILAAFASLALIRNTTPPAEAAITTIDRTHSSPSSRPEDLHEVTCHHRYYGSLS